MTSYRRAVFFSDANALATARAGARRHDNRQRSRSYTECDVVRGIGAPDNVNLRTMGVGERVRSSSSRGQRAESIPSRPDAGIDRARRPRPGAQPKTPNPKREEVRPTEVAHAVCFNQRELGQR